MADAPVEVDPTADEDALNLDRADRRRIQAVLSAVGFGPGWLDRRLGRFGGSTREAIREWQVERGFPATGYLTADEAARLTEAALEADEDALNLDRADRGRVQEGLSVAGLRPGPLERRFGHFGASTRKAIQEWQAERDVPPTGYLTADEAASLAETARRVDSANQTETALRLDRADRQRIHDGLWGVGFKPGWLDRRLGRFGDSTRDAIREWQAKRGVWSTGYLTEREAASLTETALDLDGAGRRRIQDALRGTGFDPGPADGVFGPRTRRAIRSWQTSRRVRATGYLNADQAADLTAPGAVDADRSPDVRRARHR